MEVILTGGEISLLPEEYDTAVKWFRKVEQQKDVKFTFGVLNNGTNIQQLFKHHLGSIFFHFFTCNFKD